MPLINGFGDEDQDIATVSIAQAEKNERFTNKNSIER